MNLNVYLCTFTCSEFQFVVRPRVPRYRQFVDYYIHLLPIYEPHTYVYVCMYLCIVSIYGVSRMEDSERGLYDNFTVVCNRLRNTL